MTVRGQCMRVASGPGGQGGGGRPGSIFLHACFFFSSRRRHTRFKCDWSSDVCSSDLGALGGFLFGFDTAVISGTTQELTTVYHLSPGQLGLTVSMALIGTVIGAMTAGIPGQKYGGPETLGVLALFFVVSALGFSFSWNFALLPAAPSLRRLRSLGSSYAG